MLSTNKKREQVFGDNSVIIFFLYLHKNICCGYSLEVPCKGASNDYCQILLNNSSKKNIYMYIDTILGGVDN